MKKYLVFFILLIMGGCAPIQNTKTGCTGKGEVLALCMSREKMLKFQVQEYIVSHNISFALSQQKLYIER